MVTQATVSGKDLHTLYTAINQHGDKLQFLAKSCIPCNTLQLISMVKPYLLCQSQEFRNISHHVQPKATELTEKQLNQIIQKYFSVTLSTGFRLKTVQTPNPGFALR